MEQSSRKEVADDELGNTKSESVRLEEKKYISQQKEVDRRDSLASTVNTSVKIMVWVVLVGAILMIGTILLHYILHKDQVWLDEGRLRELKSFALSGVIGSLVTLAFNSVKDLMN
ncbi:hypothetical protein COTS27_01655 [Spirochaetota bacterium]|nr:hypothetical protein COTS27_01655 [Spirochaetota bacterium]